MSKFDTMSKEVNGCSSCVALMLLLEGEKEPFKCERCGNVVHPKPAHEPAA